MKIVLIAGSNSGRKTREIINIAEELLPEIDKDLEIEKFDLASIEMVFADGRHFQDYNAEFKEVLESIIASDAVLISSPVYNAGLPSTLTNLLNALPDKALQGKAVGIIMTAGSSNHSLVAQYQLKPNLSYLKAHIVPSYVLINDKSFVQGKVIDGDVRYRIQDLLFDTILLARGLKFMEAEEGKLLGF